MAPFNFSGLIPDSRLSGCQSDVITHLGLFLTVCTCLDEGIGIYACTHLCVERCTHVQQMYVQAEGNLSCHSLGVGYLLFESGSLIHLELCHKVQASRSLSFQRSTSQPHSLVGYPGTQQHTQYIMSAVGI